MSKQAPYPSADALAEHFKCDSRTIRKHLEDAVVAEDIYYFRPFGGRTLGGRGHRR